MGHYYVLLHVLLQLKATPCDHAVQHHQQVSD
jgi:hypothetical protein